MFELLNLLLALGYLVGLLLFFVALGLAVVCFFVDKTRRKRFIKFTALAFVLSVLGLFLPSLLMPVGRPVMEPGPGTAGEPEVSLQKT